MPAGRPNGGGRGVADAGWTPKRHRSPLGALALVNIGLYKRSRPTFIERRSSGAGIRKLHLVDNECYRHCAQASVAASNSTRFAYGGARRGLRAEARRGLRAEARRGLRAEARRGLRAEARRGLRAEARRGLRAEGRRGLRAGTRRGSACRTELIEACESSRPTSSATGAAVPGIESAQLVDNECYRHCAQASAAASNSTRSAYGGSSRPWFASSSSLHTEARRGPRAKARLGLLADARRGRLVSRLFDTRIRGRSVCDASRNARVARRERGPTRCAAVPPHAR